MKKPLPLPSSAVSPSPPVLQRQSRTAKQKKNASAFQRSLALRSMQAHIDGARKGAEARGAKAANHFRQSHSYFPPSVYRLSGLEAYCTAAADGGPAFSGASAGGTTPRPANGRAAAPGVAGGP